MITRQLRWGGGAGGHLEQHWVLPTGRTCLFLPGLLDAAGPAWGIAAALGPNPLHWPGHPPTSQPLLMLAANLSHLHPSPAFCPGWKGGAYFSRVTSTMSPHPAYAPVPQAFLQFLHHCAFVGLNLLPPFSWLICSQDDLP